MAGVTTSLHAVSEPSELDGGDEMYPLRSAQDLAELTGFSTRYINELMSTGQLPYVLFPPADPRRGAEQQEGKRRRVRNDQWRQFIESLPQE